MLTRTRLLRAVRTGGTGQLTPEAPRTVRTGYAYVAYVQCRAYRVPWHHRRTPTPAAWWASRSTAAGRGRRGIYSTVTAHQPLYWPLLEAALVLEARQARPLLYYTVYSRGPTRGPTKGPTRGPTRGGSGTRGLHCTAQLPGEAGAATLGCSPSVLEAAALYRACRLSCVRATRAFRAAAAPGTHGCRRRASHQSPMC